MKHLAILLLLPLTMMVGCKKDNPDDNSVNFFSVEQDMELGEQVEDEIASDPANYPLLDSSQYPEAYGHLHRIFNTILGSGQVFYADKFNWGIHIIRDDSTLNAFCTPGGKIYVYTGLIKYLDSEDQLAGVMGHEIAHADRRHSTDQLTKQYGLSLLLSIVLGDSSRIGDIAGSLVLLNYSRDAEREADDYSVIYLNPTEYDARGAARFFEKLIAAGNSGGPPEFLSSHPNSDDRVADIMAKWEELGSKEGGTFPERYADFKASLP